MRNIHDSLRNVNWLVLLCINVIIIGFMQGCNRDSTDSSGPVSSFQVVTIGLNDKLELANLVGKRIEIEGTVANPGKGMKELVRGDTIIRIQTGNHKLVHGQRVVTVGTVKLLEVTEADLERATYSKGTSFFYLDIEQFEIVSE